MTPPLTRIEQEEIETFNKYKPILPELQKLGSSITKRIEIDTGLPPLPHDPNN